MIQAQGIVCVCGDYGFFDCVSSYIAANHISHIVSASTSFAGWAPEIRPVSTEKFSLHLISQYVKIHMWQVHVGWTGLGWQLAGKSGYKW